ncbi:tellurite resistance TerB family protein [Pelistega suis]|uniref:Tellurite resistance TerB family protein n=1 Tax=Pelistega suis TaxID=1631957 RepID=A0A849P7L9_9BURK|nr:tellurite resistance TerB family protein [Pelistega suis]NOL51765.1 tellurite resistance TerB family protein [Pelistega suis]
MSAFNILEQLLGKGTGGLLGDLQQQAREKFGQATQSDRFNQAQAKGADIFNQIKNATTGTSSVLTSGDKTGLAAGALAVLLGQKTDSSLAKLGGMAALGTIAFKAFQRWQEQQAAMGTPSTETIHRAPGAVPPAQIPAPSLDNAVSAETEQVSRALLVAMIAAAKADGHIQEDEKAQLDQHLAQLTDAQDCAWFQAEINRPVDPSYVASYANNTHLAAQMYALSIAMCNNQNFMEKAYLEELAKQLNLEASLKQEIERQVTR